MFVNDIYLTILRRLSRDRPAIRRPPCSHSRQEDRWRSFRDEAEALSELSDVTTAIRETLGAYGARSLWSNRARRHLAFRAAGVPAPARQWRRAAAMPLPRMPLDEALSQKRIFFGRNAIEIRGASEAETRFGAMLSIREYPAFSGRDRSTCSSRSA